MESKAWLRSRVENEDDYGGGSQFAWSNVIAANINKNLVSSGRLAARKPPLHIFSHCVPLDGVGTDEKIREAIKQFFGRIHDSEVCPERGSYLVCPKRVAKHEHFKVTVI